MHNEGNYKQGEKTAFRMAENKANEATDKKLISKIYKLRVGHEQATSLSLFTFMHWRRKWQPTPVFLPGESQGWHSLVGSRLWGRTESDMTEAT